MDFKRYYLMSVVMGKCEAIIFLSKRVIRCVGCVAVTEKLHPYVVFLPDRKKR